MPRLARLAAPAAVALLCCLGVPSRGDDVVDEARAMITKGDPAAAVDRLERALDDTAADRIPAVLEALRDAYDLAAARAESEGKTREAKHYRDGRKLLNRPAPEPPPGDPKPEAGTSKATPPPEKPKPTPTEPAVEKAESVAPSVDHLKLADAAWKAADYRKAGEQYAALARAGNMPPARRDHWAYCRLVTVLDRINSGPKTPAEWSEIHAEIDHIRVLSPKNWYSEYLRNVVVERSGGVRPAKRNDLVVRAAAPEEKAPAKRPARVRAKSSPTQKASPQVPAEPPTGDGAKLPKADDEAPRIQQPAAPIDPEVAPAVGQAGPAHGNWKTFVTPSFRIFHDDEELAKKVAARAEAARRDAIKRWTGAEPLGAWSPRCDLYLYPTAEVFAEQTGQLAESPGFSTAGLEGGRVTTRMVKLRTDFARMIDAVLPHEVTHIVLADLFPVRQIPRWADEGMAVLSEPANEQARRVHDLAAPVRDDVLFRLDVLMTTDYPSGTHWPLYYAQSVSLTRYLVGLGTPQQFVRFVRESQNKGIDPALKSIYRIESVAQLETRWKAHARQTANPATASAADSGGAKGEAVRR